MAVQKDHSATASNASTSTTRTAVKAASNVTTSTSSPLVKTGVSSAADAAVATSIREPTRVHEFKRSGRAIERPGTMQWREAVDKNIRRGLIEGMMEEMQRISGDINAQELRKRASRFESLIWRNSASQDEYMAKLKQRIQALQRQASRDQAVSNGLSQVNPPQCDHAARADGSTRAHVPVDLTVLNGSSMEEAYFTRLTEMRAQYRDEVALVYRELCRVNTVIQQSAVLRRHESNNLGDFLNNLKKIMYLLEQRPDEVWGMIPTRKRTLDYLNVVQSHIERKVLPILQRLRHTYSTILTPLLRNFFKTRGRPQRRR